MKHRLIAIALTILPLFSSCKDTDEYTTDARENFETLWKILDENYCFFSYKEVDWNEVYDRYSVQIADTMNQYALFDVLADMLAELKDGHTNLYSSFDVARYWDWYQDYPPNFYEELNEKYLGKENIHVMHYIPEYYQMRDRCKAVVQTGDYGIHGQAILIAGYPSADIPMEWLKKGVKDND